nr:uncharacterized protein LOC127328464 [Lolium perenne]
MAVFNAATAEEARRHRAEEIGEWWHAEREQRRCRADEMKMRWRADELYERRRVEELREWMRELHQRQRQGALEHQLREEVATAEAAAWSDNDGPDPEEAVAHQQALLESFESQKKLQDDARAREEEQVRRVVELSLQQEQLGRVGDDAANEHRRLLVTLRRRRRRAAQELRRRGGDDRAGPSNAPLGGQ